MPVENGFVFLDEFEKLPDSIKMNTKIVVITHSIDERDQVKSLTNKNVSYFIDKPLTIEKLELLAETI
jgi:CheY-like chemotaxis protein